MGTVFASMAVSLDGYIASATGELDWINEAMVRGEDYGFSATMQRTGAYVMGANTYREAAGFSRGGADSTPTYVVTHGDLEDQPGHVQRFSGDLRNLMTRVRAETDGDVFVFGGADLVTQFIDLDLLDELTISIVPTLLGAGVRLVGTLGDWKRLTLGQCRHFERSGIVLLTYRLDRLEGG